MGERRWCQVREERLKKCPRVLRAGDSVTITSDGLRCYGEMYMIRTIPSMHILQGLIDVENTGFGDRLVMKECRNWTNGFP